MAEVVGLLSAASERDDDVVTGVQDGDSRLTTIGPYTILGELGRGAMGVVYRAQDPAIGRIVAIKTIQLDRFGDDAGAATLRERFLREARSAGSLSHPGIVTVHQLGEHEGRPYIVMEYVDGGSLDRYMPGAPNPARPDAILRGLITIASALDYAHGQNLIHRDIKPGNILVSKNGAFKIGDFGLVKILRETAQISSTGLLGTPLYFAPELLRGSPASAQSDQYALGVLAYHVVTGKLPYSPGSTEQLLFQIVAAPPPKASGLNPALHPAVDAVLDRVLSKDPALRYPTCRQFINALHIALQRPAEPEQTPKAAPPSLPPHPPVSPPPRYGGPEPSPKVVIPSSASARWKTPLTIALALPMLGLMAWLGWTAWRLVGKTGSVSVPVIRLESVPVPYVSEMPPLVENMPTPQVPVEPASVTGPRDPHIVWRAVGSVSPYGPGCYSVTLAGLGSDGSTYLRDYNHIWALRDGRLQWGYKVDYTDDPRPQMALDGRVWITSGMIFNRDGIGGRVRGAFHPPASLKLPPYESCSSSYRPLQRFNCVSARNTPAGWHEAGPGLEGHDDQGKRWFLPLDNDCADVQLTRDGNLYAATSTKTLYRIDSSGRVLWTFPARCANPTLRSLPSGDLAIACGKEQLQCVREGRLLWTFTDAKMREIGYLSRNEVGVQVDQAGTTYFSDWSLDRPCMFYAVDSHGKLKWKINLGDNDGYALQFDHAGRIYVAGEGYNGETRGSGILCLSDTQSRQPSKSP
jgi:serine/threonine-protein kinase